MKVAERKFRIEDIDCVSIVEVVNKQKDILDVVDEFIENLQYDFFDPSDDSFAILYKDGTMDFIDACYDGHKVRRNNIASMVYNNACSAVVYGGFEVNEYGVVTTSEAVVIADNNITEI